jgi:hypothetical protein
LQCRKFGQNWSGAMARPFTRAQSLQNRAFLRALERTGNVREAARDLGIHRSTLTKRRAAHPAFAAEWDAALALAHAALLPPRDGEGDRRPKAVSRGGVPRTATAQPHLHRTPSGRLQLRRAGPRRLTRVVEQAFLAALSASANIRLSAAATGFSHSAFYQHARASPAFAREMRLALQMGYERLEMALIESWSPASHADDDWRHNDPPPIPPMTANQALQLLYLHQKEARLLAEPAHIRRRRGESKEAHSFRLSAMYEARLQRDREAFELAEAERRGQGEPCLGDAAGMSLPDLAQVRGWSRAKGEEEPEQDRALFGGRRVGDLGDSIA